MQLSKNQFPNKKAKISQQSFHLKHLAEAKLTGQCVLLKSWLFGGGFFFFSYLYFFSSHLKIHARLVKNQDSPFINHLGGGPVVRV
jgi:hypothetical protein